MRGPWVSIIPISETARLTMNIFVWKEKGQHKNGIFLPYSLQLTGVLNCFVARNMKNTKPFPNMEINVKAKKKIPNISTTRGCWGGNFPQWSWTTSLISSGKLSKCVAPKRWKLLKYRRINYPLPSLTNSLCSICTGCPINNCIFSKAHCSYKSNPISKISSLVSRELIEFYVGIICGNMNLFT